jgi:hypothetical protein
VAHVQQRSTGQMVREDDKLNVCWAFSIHAHPQTMRTRSTRSGPAYVPLTPAAPAAPAPRPAPPPKTRLWWTMTEGSRGYSVWTEQPDYDSTSMSYPKLSPCWGRQLQNEYYGSQLMPGKWAVGDKVVAVTRPWMSDKHQEGETGVSGWGLYPSLADALAIFEPLRTVNYKGEDTWWMGPPEYHVLTVRERGPDQKMSNGFPRH